MSGTPIDISVPGPTVTVHSLPSSNPAGTSDTVALPVQGVTGGVPLPVSAASLPLPVGAAQDGTDATGVTPLAGAVGIRGWLSGMYSKLASSISVTGTFWQATQPVSAASLPLPVGAATAANQPTSAAQGSTTSGQTGRLMQGAVTAAAPSYTTAQTSPLSLDTAGNLRVNVVAGGGGASGNVAQGSTTAGETGVMIQGAVTTAAPSYTTAQTSPVSLTTAGGIRIDGSGVTQPISATSLPLPAGAATAANQPTSAAQGSTTSGQTGRLMQGAVTAAAPAYVTAQTSPLSLDTAGNLRVNIVAAGSASGNVAQGSATAGETGVMIQGAVTTAAPSYSTAQTSPVSLTTAGGLRIDGSGVTQPISATSLPLPAGAATAANQPTSAAQGSTTSGQTGRLMQGAVTAAAPAYVTAQTSPISLTPAGAVRTDASATTQPISAASLPLPAGAATAAGVAAINTTLGTPMQATGGTVGIAAGTNAIGSIIGRTTMVTATPAVTSNGAYAAGNEIGGLLTFAIGGAGSGTLMSMRVTSRSVLATALKAYIFSANPSNTPWTNKTAPAINSADIASLLAVIPLNAPDSGLGTHTLWELSGIAAQFVAANLYVVLVTVSAATLTSGTTSDFTVQLGVSDD